MTPPDSLTLLERRAIEARIVGPLLRAFADRFGTEATLETARGVIEELARRAGADLARKLGANDLETFAKAVELWSEGGALEIEPIESTGESLAFDVVRCRYAEMYRELGLEDLGSALSCSRDFALIQGFNPDVELARGGTLMEGAARCGFRFRRGGADRTREATDSAATS